MHNVKLDSFDCDRSQNYARNLLFVTLLSVAVCAIVTADRSLTLQNFVKRTKRLDSSSRLTHCTGTFIEQYFEDSDRISVLLPQQNASDLVEMLMKELYARNASVYTFNMQLTDKMTKYDASTIIIPLESLIALEGTDFSFTNYCNRDCNIAVVLTNPFDDEESFLNDVGTLTQEMWLRSILKLAILASVGDAVLFAERLMVRIDKSYASVKLIVRLLGRCEQDAAYAIHWRFTNKVESSAVASAINVAIFNHFPYTFMINNTNRQELGGIEGWMVEEIVRSMNVKLNRKLIKQTNATIEKEIRVRLYNATDDLVCGGLIMHSDRNGEYTISYGRAYVAWMVPITPNVSLRGLIASFNPSVWYAIICTFIIGGFVKFIIRDISILGIAALVLGNAINQPTRFSSRILFISWSLFGFFITQFYLGSLAEQLMKTTDEQIDSMEELLNSGLVLGGTEKYLNLLDASNETKIDEHDGVMQAIHDKYVIFEEDDFIKSFMDLTEGRNTSLALLVMLNLTDVHHKSSNKYVHIIKQAVGIYPLALATWEGFPYLREFNFKMQSLVQAGLIRFWSYMTILYYENYYEKIDSETDSDIIELIDLAPAFLLLVIGYLAAFCLLIIEVILYPSRYLM